MEKQNKGNFSEWKQRKAFLRSEFERKYAKYYMVYIALIGTGVLSGLTGILLPFSQSATAQAFFISAIAGVYFAFGFLTNGEIAANYWFGKLTDHDPDNRIQQIVAGVSLFLSVVVSLVTALASSLLIAYWLNIFPAFNGVPDWAQVWIVDIIPVMWIYHAVAGMLFKAMSEEAQMERLSRAFVREKQNELNEAKEEAKVGWWRENARAVYEHQGRKEAEEDVQRRFPRQNMSVAVAQEVATPKLPPNPPTPPSQQ
jgi:hypothetical protein